MELQGFIKVCHRLASVVFVACKVRGSVQVLEVREIRGRMTGGHESFPFL